MFTPLITLLLALSVAGATTTTYEETDPHITYSGKWNQAFPCKLTSDGKFVGGQEGCFNIQPNCTESFYFSSTVGDSATIKFTGSAITVASLSSTVASVVSVSLDDAAPESIDTHSDSKAFTCAALIQKDGLDPTKEHTLVLTLVGASSQPDSQGVTQIMVDSVTITNSDGSSSSAAAPPNQTQPGSGTSIRSGLSGSLLLISALAAFSA